MQARLLLKDHDSYIRNYGCTDHDPNCYVYRIIDGVETLVKVIPGIPGMRIHNCTEPPKPKEKFIKPVLPSPGKAIMVKLWRKHKTVKGVATELKVSDGVARRWLIEEKVVNERLKTIGGKR